MNKLKQKIENKRNLTNSDKKSKKSLVNEDKKTNKSLNNENDELITGLGDVVKKVTNALGIKTCDKCEERRRKLNQMFSFLSVGKLLNQDEIDFISNLGTELSPTDSKKLLDIYNSTYNVKQKHCNCPGMYKGIIEKLQRQIIYQSEDENI